MPAPSARKRSQAPLKAYWQPGCTSCLRMKEFLMRHGVPFVSVNVLEDAHGYEELAAFGVRSVPVVARGVHWANGQVLADVARVAGIKFTASEMLPPAELYRRLVLIQCAAQRLFAQVPDDRVMEMLPGRPRSYGDLTFHIFHIAELFADHAVNKRALLDGDYDKKPPAGMSSRGAVLGFGRQVQTRLHTWWEGGGKSGDFSQAAQVYYGAQTLHEFLERSAWHCGQHVRQLTLVVEKLGIAPDRPLGPEVWDGLPMPSKIWDDEAPFKL